MNVIFSDKAWEDYLYWQKNDKNMTEKIHDLIKDTQRSPYKGVGKPEPLKHALAGYWSRRINHEHRFVYKVDAHGIMIAQLRYHY